MTAHHMKGCRYFLPALYACILLLYPGRSGAEGIQDYPFRVALTSGTAQGVVRIEVPREVLKRSTPLMAECRVFDDKGVETPFVVEREQAPGTQEMEWEVLSVRNMGGSLEYIIERKGDEPLYDVRVETGRGLILADAEVYALTGTSQGRLIARERIADLRPEVDYQGMRIMLPATYSRRLLVRFRRPVQFREMSDCLLLNKERAQGLPLPGLPDAKAVFLSSLSSGSGPEALDELIIKAPVTERGPGNTLLLKLGRFDLPVERVSLDFNLPCFCAGMELLQAPQDMNDLFEERGSGVICRVAGMVSRPHLPVHGFIKGSFLTIRVDGHGSEVPAVRRVIIGWSKRYLYFMPAKDRTYRLYFGAAGAEPARYDIRKKFRYRYDGRIFYNASWKTEIPEENDAFKPRYSWGRDLKNYMLAAMVLLVIYLVGFLILRIRVL